MRLASGTGPFPHLGRDTAFDPSSRKCGFHNADLTLADREWECPNCHAILDRDTEFSTRMKLLPPSIMAKPVIFLCSDEAEGITGERITATDFDAWLKARNQRMMM